jgi:hypothetical protein
VKIQCRKQRRFFTFFNHPAEENDAPKVQLMRRTIMYERVGAERFRERSSQKKEKIVIEAKQSVVECRSVGDENVKMQHDDNN